MQKKLMLHKKQFCVERKKKQFDIAQKANWCQQKKLDTAQKHCYLLKKCINCFLQRRTIPFSSFSMVQTNI